MYRCSNLDILQNAFDQYGASLSTEVDSDQGQECATVELLVPWILAEVHADVAIELFNDLHRDRFCHGSEGFAYSFYPERGAPVAMSRGLEFLRFIFGSLSAPEDWSQRK